MWLRRNLKFSLIVGNLFLAFFMVLCFLVPFIDPRVYWPISFLGLAYPYLFLLCVGFFAFWVILRKWYFLISLVTIILGWTYSERTFNWHFEDVLKEEKSIKILSYNVRNFDFYNWRERTQSKDKFFKLFKREDADILCFQEFFHLEDSTSELEYVDSLSQRLGYPHYYFHTRVHSFNQRYGMAIFSKYPIVNNAKMDFKTRAKNGCIYADITIGDSLLRVYNVHFQSIQFSHDDYAYFESNEKDVKGMKTIFKKLKKAFMKRADQADFLAKHLNLNHGKVVLCGDFNDTPMSYSYERIKQSRRFKDAFVEVGNGFGSTYVGAFPFMRIDHFFVDDNLELKSFKVLEEKYSDHYPIICEIVI